MRKKILLFLMIVAMFVLFAVPAYASCDICIDYEYNLHEANPNHCTVHCLGDGREICSCGDWYTKDLCSATHQYAYVYTNGTHTAICACDDLYTEECTFEKKSVFPSTCQYAGYEVYECTVCKGTYTKSLPQADHTWEINQVYSASCTTYGRTEWKCLTCDDFKTENNVDPLGHDWYEMTRDAECEISGEHYKVCDRCGLDESSVIPAPGHAWSVDPIENTSTCFYAGVATYVCQVCGEENSRPSAKIDHIFKNEKCTMCGIAESAVESTAPPIGGGSSSDISGSSGAFIEDLVNSDVPNAKRFLSLIVIGTLFFAVVAFIKFRE